MTTIPWLLTRPNRVPARRYWPGDYRLASAMKDTNFMNASLQLQRAFEDWIPTKCLQYAWTWTLDTLPTESWSTRVPQICHHSTGGHPVFCLVARVPPLSNPFEQFRRHHDCCICSNFSPWCAHGGSVLLRLPQGARGTGWTDDDLRGRVAWFWFM